MSGCPADQREPRVVVRTRGERKFGEVPNSEIAAVMRHMSDQYRFESQDERFRHVLDSYKTRRMTNGIRNRLLRIDERREELLSE